MAAPKGVPKSREQRARIQASHRIMARERRYGQILRLSKLVDSGELANLVCEYVVQASIDWEKNGELSDEQVNFLNRLSALAGR